MFLLFRMALIKCPECELHLHSNMFLLFLPFQLLSKYFHAHLHSNMFLLFLKVPRNTIGGYEVFTFQYVSIISANRSAKSLDKFYLHSNMFLLFLLSVELRISPVVIYIPICFYYFLNKLLYSLFSYLFTFQYVSIISIIFGHNINNSA